MNKEEIIKEIRNKEIALNKSPGRRDFSMNFYNECIKSFGSFNNAKLEAGLKIFRRKCESLPERAYILDEELAKVVSFITFDGHLYRSLRGFHLYSKNEEILKEFALLIRNKFGVAGYYGKSYNGYGECLRYKVFNVNLCKFLDSVGTPSGNKVLSSFCLPRWIKNDKKLVKVYLKIAYYCEGTFKEYDRPNPRIGFSINKSEKLLSNGINFLCEIKKSLEDFGIETTPIYVMKGNIRKDKIQTKLLRFRVITKCNNKFINKIGWIK